MIFPSPSDPFVDRVANHVHWAGLDRVLQGELEIDLYLGTEGNFRQLDGLDSLDLVLVELSLECQSSDRLGILGYSAHHQEVDDFVPIGWSVTLTSYNLENSVSIEEIIKIPFVHH